jgi:hypothetical protein
MKELSHHDGFAAHNAPAPNKRRARIDVRQRFIAVKKTQIDF